MLDFNLGSIFSCALTGNTAPQLPHSAGKDLEEKPLELLFRSWVSVSSADLRKFQAKIMFWNIICHLSLPLQVPVGGKLVVDGVVHAVPDRAHITIHLPGTLANIFWLKTRVTLTKQMNMLCTETLHHSSALHKRSEQAMFSFHCWWGNLRWGEATWFEATWEK